MGDVDHTLSKNMPPGTAFSIMFVTIGFSCFVWQTLTVGEMLYKSRKPIIGLVLFQAFLGIIVTVVTLLTSLIDIGCNFRLIFSVVGVNVGDMSLQFVLLWKAYLGNNRSKVILILGLIPIFGIAIFILINMTIGKSETNLNLGVCATDYPTFIVIIKASIDCTSNAFLSACFILVIYRHYRTLGSSIQRTLLTEGLIYCFGVCFSNILTGILLTKNVLGGNTPIIYTIDWYLASFLIIKQLRQRHNKAPKDQDDEDGASFVDGSSSIITANFSRTNDNGDKTLQLVNVNRITEADKENQIMHTETKIQDTMYRPVDDHRRNTYHPHSVDNSTLVPSSPISRSSSPYIFDKEEQPIYSIPSLPQKIAIPGSLNPPPRKEFIKEDELTQNEKNNHDTFSNDS